MVTILHVLSFSTKIEFPINYVWTPTTYIKVHYLKKTITCWKWSVLAMLLVCLLKVSQNLIREISNKCPICFYFPLHSRCAEYNGGGSLITEWAGKWARDDSNNQWGQRDRQTTICPSAPSPARSTYARAHTRTTDVGTNNDRAQRA